MYHTVFLWFALSPRIHTQTVLQFILVGQGGQNIHTEGNVSVVFRSRLKRNLS